MTPKKEFVFRLWSVKTVDVAVLTGMGASFAANPMTGLGLAGFSDAGMD